MAAQTGMPGAAFQAVGQQTMTWKAPHIAFWEIVTHGPGKFKRPPLSVATKASPLELRTAVETGVMPEPETEP